MQTFNIEQTDSQCVVTWRHFSCGLLLVWLFTLACSTLGGAITIFMLFVQPTFTLALFALLFGVLWLLMFTEILHTVAGKTEVNFGENGFVATYSCLGVKREKQVDLAMIDHFDKRIGKWSDSIVQVVCNKNIKLRVPPRLENELGNLCDHLNAFLGTIKADSNVSPQHP